jgi:hypothetical protein
MFLDGWLQEAWVRRGIGFSDWRGGFGRGAGSATVWTGVLLSIVDGQTRDIWDSKALGQYFGMIVTQDVAIAQFLFCFSLPPIAPLAVGRQWMHASKKLLDQVICNWKMANAEKSRDSLIRVVSACIELIKSR